MQTEENKKRFEQLMEQHRGILYKVARTYCQNETDRPDLLQEMLIQLWLSFHKYDDRYKFTTWMYRVALNVAISNFRKSKSNKHDAISLDGDAVQIAAHDTSGLESQHLLLQQFISELKALDRALMLLYLDERPYKEIAEIIGISESNVSTKVSRIKENLKRKFANTKN